MRQRGYIALITVLVLGAVSTAVALALVMIGSDSQRTSLVQQRSTQARALAASCADEALQQLDNNSAFVGSNSLSLGQGTCNYIVTNAGGSTRVIFATGTVGGVVRKIEVNVAV